MERWWFHMIAGADGTEQQVRIVLRSGDDEAAFPTAQVMVDGTEVAPDDSPVDYEAPEWKAKQIVADGEQVVEAVKERLRSEAS
jgi:hypothetical protein